MLSEDLKNTNKEKVNPYIESILYPSFPTRTYVEITINLRKDIPSKFIKVMFEKEAIVFKKKGKEIFVQANKNGEYIVIINEKKTKFLIDRVDIFAPELVALTNHGSYLVVDIKDELSQIDYNKFYIEYAGKQYKIPKDHKIIGTFKGTIVVVMFDKNGNFIRYKDNTTY